MAGETYFEHVIIGRHLKVTAIDPATGVEVSVYGPSSAPPFELERLAMRKLEARLAADRRPAGPVPTSTGRGRLA